MAERSPNARLDLLVEGYLEGTLDVEECRELRGRLEREPELVDAILAGLRTESLLRETLEEALTAAGGVAGGRLEVGGLESPVAAAPSTIHLPPSTLPRPQPPTANLQPSTDSTPPPSAIHQPKLSRGRWWLVAAGVAAALIVGVSGLHVLGFLPTRYTTIAIVNLGSNPEERRLGDGTTVTAAPGARAEARGADDARKVRQLIRLESGEIEVKAPKAAAGEVACRVETPEGLWVETVGTTFKVTRTWENEKGERNVDRRRLAGTIGALLLVSVSQGQVRTGGGPAGTSNLAQGAEGEVKAAAQVVAGLAECGGLPVERGGTATRWLARHQRKDGSWPGGWPAAAAPKPVPGLSAAEKSRAADLIAQLGSEEYAVREKATAALIAMGPAVSELAAAAQASKDAEVRERLDRILREVRPGLAAPGSALCTGLALLAFLGAGYTDREGEHRGCVASGLNWLLGAQGTDGAIGWDRSRLEDEGGAWPHLVCGLALAEASGMTRDQRLGAAAQKAVEFSVNRLQAGSAGPGGADKGKIADLATATWLVMQLKSAKVAGLKVDGAAFQSALALVNELTDANGQAAIRKGEKGTPAMTAAGMVCRQFMGTPNTEPIQVKAAGHLEQHLPKWGAAASDAADASADASYYYWHHGTLAMFQHGGESWRKWNEALKLTLLDRQRRGGPLDGSDLDVDGSWDPQGGIDRRAGRTYTTALAALSLAVYYRYLPVLRR